MNFAIYIIGAILVVIGLAYGASQMGVGSTWIIIGAIVIIGIAIMAGVSKTRMKDPPAQ
jgi:uncharacterized membrane protein